MIDYAVPILINKLLIEMKFKFTIVQLAIKEAKKENYHREGRVVTPGDHYFGKLADFALH